MILHFFLAQSSQCSNWIALLHHPPVRLRNSMNKVIYVVDDDTNDEWWWLIIVQCQWFDVTYITCGWSVNSSSSSCWCWTIRNMTRLPGSSLSHHWQYYHCQRQYTSDTVTWQAQIHDININFAAGSFYTKKLCSRVYSTELGILFTKRQFAFWATLWGVRGNFIYSSLKARGRLPIGYNWTFFASSTVDTL